MKFKILIICLLTSFYVNSQQVLDDFESTEGWSFIQSDGVKLKLNIDEGSVNKAIRFDYDFTKGTGYGGFQKWFPLDLPENFEISFLLKATSPSNNFEIKLIDSSGNNVWWVSNRNFEFPSTWKRIKIKKRHISFAWGPTPDQSLKRIDRIEFTVASFLGGKGTLWIDDLRFEEIEPETDNYPIPVVSVLNSGNYVKVSALTDGDSKSEWMSANGENQTILVDFRGRREFGGLQLDWLEGHSAATVEVLSSMNGSDWEPIGKLQSNKSDKSFIRIPEAEARFLKLLITQPTIKERFGLSEIRFLTVKESLTMNDFLIYAASKSATGDYPRYFLQQASYWTVMGVNNDVKEAMISEDGMVEVEKAGFSIEPAIQIKGKLYNWPVVSKTQRMGDEKSFDFVPSVDWDFEDILFSTELEATGEANKDSRLIVTYTFKNQSDKQKDLDFYLLIRPFQVNPYYQFLNLPGGVGKIREISIVDNQMVKVDSKMIFSERPFDEAGVAAFGEGNPMDMIRKNENFIMNHVVDNEGLANGMLKYRLSIEAGKELSFRVAVPFYKSPDQAENMFDQELLDLSRAFWQNKVGHIKFNLPESADRLIQAYQSNLAYILINRDKAGIQPGSRSYERSWIRDGSLTSSALLKSGIVEEVKDFIQWYAAHQYENGKVPCVVDFRGPDPVPEHDSHGQLIYLMREYFNFTGDTAFLRDNNKHVLLAVSYIESLIAERSTPHFRDGNDSVRAYYGLVPESISHEGYSAKPMHSYWDNFFILKGLKDAADIQAILGTSHFERIAAIRDTFRLNLYKSIDLAMKTRKIDYIPGCVELGDFDATSTTVALTPCNELKNLPKPQVYNTFEKYYNFFEDRRAGKLNWTNYTPYENRLIGSFIILDQPDRAHQLIEYFLNDQRPQGWHHWAEVVWNDYRTPKYIGDMPHTWVGSDFINAVRSMFVYENEYDSSLVVAAALYQDWIDSPNGMSVNNLPTYYGELSYSVKKMESAYEVNLTGNLNLPANGIRLKNFNGSKQPLKVEINGKETNQFSNKEISIPSLPTVVKIYY